MRKTAPDIRLAYLTRKWLMRNSDFHLRRKLLGNALRVLAATTLLLALLFGVMSCRTVNRSVVVLPEVPGAKYIGSKECEQCHDKIYKDFATADHARLIAPGPNANNAGCESCHGPCSLHSESGGEVKPPFSFAAGRPAANSFGADLAMTPG